MSGQMGRDVLIKISDGGMPETFVTLAGIRSQPAVGRRDQRGKPGRVARVAGRGGAENHARSRAWSVQGFGQ